MFPNSPQPPPDMPADLPAVPLQPPLAGMPGAGQALPASPPPSASAQESVAEQAKQLVVQYQNNPFRLSAALAQLKSQYIAQRYNISINSADK